MGLVYLHRSRAQSLITGVTGIQGEDTPTTSGPWELSASVPSYGEANNAPLPYYTAWAGFAGARLSFATADERPDPGWTIGAALSDRAAQAQFERVEFGQRLGNDAAQITEAGIEIAQAFGSKIVWVKWAPVVFADGRGNAVFQRVMGWGIRIRVDKISESGKHPGVSGVQVFGFL